MRQAVKQLFGGRTPGVEWEFAEPFYMCFMELEKALDCVPLSISWKVLRDFGVSGLLHQLLRPSIGVSQLSITKTAHLGGTQEAC